MNPDELAKFLKVIGEYIGFPPEGTTIHLYEDCIVIQCCYDTVCSGQEGKKSAIEEHKKNIKEKILPDFPSFVIEFYFHHWHLSGYDKKGIYLGRDSFLLKMAAGLFQFNNEGKNYIDLTKYFGKEKPNSWSLPEGQYLPTYIKKHGKETNYHIMPQPPESKVPNFEKCAIEDD